MVKRLLLSTAVVLAAGSAAQGAVVFSDDFESDAFGLSTTLKNWSLGAGSVDVIGTGFYQMYGAGHYVDLNGSTGQAGLILTAPLTMTIGARYELHFDYGNNTYSNGSERLQFGVGGALDEIAIDGPVPAMIHYVFRFIARQSPANLFFGDVGSTPGDNGGPILDNVQLIQTTMVPVPAAGLMLGGALGALGLRRRKRV